MFSKKCFNGGNKHKFEPRYDEKESSFGQRISSYKGYLDRDTLFYKCYVHDICVWCGKIINKEKQ